MAMNALKFILPWCSFAMRLLRNRRGAAAVEFALILPVMAMIYLGGMQISMAVSTYRQVDLTANTVTNLVSQYTTISASQSMPDILNASMAVMYPNASTSVVITVSLVTIDKNQNATVTWSQSLNGTQRTTGSTVTVPSSLKVANTTIVLGEASYPYVAAIDFLKLGTLNLSSSIFMVPRAATTINLTS
jgi:Flp pilus assembly protein TadG